MGKGIYLFETKTKGDIVEEQLKRQLGFDLQTMLYLTAMDYSPASLWREKPISGVRYNVIRRPLSGGKGSIRKHQPTKSNPAGESDDEFYSRLGGIIGEDPEYFFMRWQVEVTADDLSRFRHQFLDNTLEQLCDWYHWVTSPDGMADPFADHVHFRYPYGVYNVLAEGGSSEMDEYLATGSELGLTRGNSLFEELS